MNDNQQDKIHVTEHIYLSPATTDYANALYHIIDSNRSFFSQFMAWPKFVKCESDTANFLADCFIKHQQDQTKTYVVSHNNLPVGLLSFNYIDKNNKTAYLGYWLDGKAQGKGIITQAIQTLTHHYAVKKIIKRFVIKCAVTNLRSNQVAKRCGFDYEGTLKQAEYLNDAFYDQNIYSLISNYI